MSSGSNLDSNASNSFRMVWICIGMLRTPFEWLEFAFEWLQFAFERFDYLWSGLNLDLNVSNPFLMVRICIRKLQSPLESFELAFECPFKWFEFGFECFAWLSSGWNLHFIASNPLRMVRICIRMLLIPFECLECEFECFESFSSGLNLDSNALNPFQKGFELAFEWLEFTLEWFKSLFNG